MSRTLIVSALLLIPAAASAQSVVVGASANQTAVAAALAAPTTDGTILGTRASLAALNPANQAQALGQFTPASLSLLPELTLRAAEFQEQSVRRYLRDFRAGGTGVNGLAGEASPGSRKFGSFAVAQGTEGRYDGDADRGRTKFGTQSVMAGIDYRMGDKSLLGVSGGYSNMDVGLDPSSARSNIRNWFAGGYGTMGVGPFYLDVFGSYGEANYDLRRAVRFGNNAGDYTTNFAFDTDGHSRTWLAGGTMGLSFNFGGVELEPFAGVRYANLKLRGINEGSSLGALNLDERKYESILSNVGLRIGGAIDIGGGATLRPEIRGAWRHEFLKDQMDGLSYGFGGDGNQANLTYNPSPLGRNYATAGAGFTVSGKGSPLSFVVDYNGEFDKDRQVHGISGGARLTF